MHTTDEPAYHFVCTLDEAKSIVDQSKNCWVSDCRCRVRRGPCKRSRSDVCVQFAMQTTADGPNKRAVSKDEVYAIIGEAKEKRLVPRPFRTEDRSGVEGICFCCDDCCGYFLGLHEPCDKGAFIERTDAAVCIDCGVCTDVCLFKARDASGERLRVDREKCYGCGVCVDACAMKAIAMVPRSNGE